MMRCVPVNAGGFFVFEMVMRILGRSATSEWLNINEIVFILKLVIIFIILVDRTIIILNSP
jgi:hypothetical protein